MVKYMQSAAHGAPGLFLRKWGEEAALSYLEFLHMSSTNDHEILMTVLAACANYSKQDSGYGVSCIHIETGGILSDAYASGVPQRSLWLYIGRIA